MISSFRRSLRQARNFGAAKGAIARLGAMAAGFLSAMLLARFLGPEQYGLYSLGLTVATMLSTGALLGLPVLTARETGYALAQGNVGAIYMFWSWVARLMLISTPLATLGLLAVVLCSLDSSEARYTVLLVSIPLVPLLAATGWFGSALLGLNHILLSILPDQILRPILLVLGMVAVMAIAGSADATTALAVLSGAAALSALSGLILLIRNRPAGAVRTVASDTSRWWKSLWPLTFVIGIQLINQNIDTLFLAAWFTDGDIGQYRIAMSVTQIAIFGVTVGNMMIHAQASGLYARREIEAVQTLLKTASRIGFSLVAAACLLLMPFGAWALSIIFGNAYAEAAEPLAVLLAGALVMSFVGAAGAALAMLGAERSLLIGAVLGVLAKILFSLILAPAFGMIGVALASAVSTALSAIYWAGALRHSFSLRSAAL